MTSEATGVTGTALTVGVLTPHAAAGPEVELPDMAPGLITAVLARIRPSELAAEAETTPPATASGLRALTLPAALDTAAESLRRRAVDAVVYASTTSGYALGHRAEAALVARLRGLCAAPVVTSASSAVAALRTHEAGRVTLVHPPWFDDELDALGVTYFRDQGFDVTLSKATDLPTEPSGVHPRHVVDWISRHLGAEVDAVFIAGTGFRAAHAVEELEGRTGRLVLEANQVMLWAVLAATGTAQEITGFGRLLRAPRPAPL